MNTDQTKLWSPDENDQLRRMAKEGFADRQIAEALHRPCSAVTARRVLYGISPGHGT